MAETQLQAGPEMRGGQVLAAVASGNLEPRSRQRVRVGSDDLHGFPHDTKTQAAG